MNSRQNKQLVTIIGIVIILWILLGTFPARADTSSWRCQNRIISLGDDADDVEELCGPPSYKYVGTQRVTLRTYQKGRPHYRGHKKEKEASADPEDKKAVPHRQNNKDLPLEWYNQIGENTSEVNWEEWTYNPGASKFIRTLKLIHGHLTRIQIGGYGFEVKPDGQFKVDVGDPAALVWLKYGPPLEVKRGFLTDDVNISRKEEGYLLYEETTVRPVYEEEWIYDLGPDTFKRKVILKDNVVTKVIVLKTRGGKR